MRKPRLTPHQIEVLLRIRRIWRDHPIPASRIGSMGALTKLRDKGYISLHNYSGPRGGKNYYITAVTSSEEGR